MAKKAKPEVDLRLQKYEEFAATHSGQYALINAEGNLVSDNTYDFIRTPSEGFVAFRKDGKNGFLRLDGTVAVYPVYESVDDFHDGMAAVKLDGRWGFIDENGETVIKPQFENLSPPYFREGLAYIVKDGKYGFIDGKGEMVIPATFENAYGFQNGLARVKVDGRWGFIDKQGKMVIPPTYDTVADGFSFGIWIEVTKANKTGLIDLEGRTVLPLAYDEVNFWDMQEIGDEKYYKFSVKPGGIGMLRGGRVVIEPIYEEISSFSEGVAAAVKDGKVGYINTDGRTVLPFEYDSGSAFRGSCTNYARVTKDKRTYIIDRTGREICDKIESLNYYGDDPIEGYVAGIKDGKYGLLDNDGHFVLPCEFDRIECWGVTSHILVCKDKKYGVYDFEGHEIVSPVFDSIGSPRTENRPVNIISKWWEKEGAISTDGEIIVNPEHYVDCNVEDNAPVIIVKDKEGKDGILRYDGSMVTLCKFDKIRRFSTDLKAIASENGKFGLIDINGDWVIPAKYEEMENTSEYLTGVKKDGKWGFINDSDEWVIAPIYERIQTGFRSGYAIVMKDGKYILINKVGKELSKPAATLNLYKPAEGMIRYKTGRKYGYLDLDGNIAIKPAFEDAEDFKHGCALVSIKVNKDPKWTFVTKDGQTHDFFDKRVFNLGDLITTDKDGKKGIYRPDGTLAVPFVLKQVSNVKDGVTIVQFA